ncbi:MAG: hypothetical protein WCU88_07535 [Elusimicrobiota bacterium]|jgi:hypothetical protein
MSANPALVEYIRLHLTEHGEEALREQLASEGIAPEEIDAAFAQLLSSRRKRPRGRAAIFGILAGISLIAAGAYFSFDKTGKTSSEPPVQSALSAPDETAGIVKDGDATLFTGHYGYMVKLPANYQAISDFQDPQKTLEVAYLYPTGTDPTNFIHEGLYGQLGILRIEAVPRRTRGGVIGIDEIKTIAKARLGAERSVYKERSAVYNGFPAYIIQSSQPFAYARAYLIGQKVCYTITAGTDNALLAKILETFVEVSPRDEPGE